MNALSKLAAGAPSGAAIPSNESTDDENRRLHGLVQELSFVMHGLSHDLREPIRTLRCYTSILAKSEELQRDPNLLECVHFVGGAAQRVDVLVNGLLEYSKLVGGERQPHSAVDMNLVVQTALANLHLKIEESSAAVVYDTLPVVIGDSVQLTELVQNLLSNSIKYRGADPPQVLIRSEPRGREHLFSVEDNGIGIDAKHHNTIFTPFRRLHGAEFPGAGLGLTICHHIVELHHGQLWVESSPGRGSTFRFLLPAAIG